ncbi:MAG: hypothetical protein N4A35_01840 [Flavobacteriales bacterium]|nr:hypothetical protein [Flavobacteriales bacterium]
MRRSCAIFWNSYAISDGSYAVLRRSYAISDGSCAVLRRSCAIFTLPAHYRPIIARVPGGFFFFFLSDTVSNFV